MNWLPLSWNYLKPKCPFCGNIKFQSWQKGLGDYLLNSLKAKIMLDIVRVKDDFIQGYCIREGGPERSLNSKTKSAKQSIWENFNVC